MSYNFNQYGTGAFGPRGAERPQGALSTLADWVSKSLEIEAPPSRVQAMVGTFWILFLSSLELGTLVDWTGT